MASDANPHAKEGARVEARFTYEGWHVLIGVVVLLGDFAAIAAASRARPAPYRRQR